MSEEPSSVLLAFPANGVFGSRDRWQLTAVFLSFEPCVAPEDKITSRSHCESDFGSVKWLSNSQMAL